MDWLAFELPSEGEDGPLVGDAYRRGLPTCSPDDSIGRVRGLFRDGWDWVVVLNSRGVILGRLRRTRLGDDDEAAAADVMEPGPSTYRANVPLPEMISKMKSGGFENALVSDPDGRLLGVLNRADAESALAGNNK